MDFYSFSLQFNAMLSRIVYCVILLHHHILKYIQRQNNFVRLSRIDFYFATVLRFEIYNLIIYVCKKTILHNNHCIFF